MKTAYMSFEHDIEDGWYRMVEPEPHKLTETWSFAIDAFEYAKTRGWKVVWTGLAQYKPSGIDFDEE